MLAIAKEIDVPLDVLTRVSPLRDNKDRHGHR
jgi:hypothetical protein